MMDSAIGLWSLFLSAFISSTLFPGGSEVLLLYLASEAEHSLVTLLVVATVGNSLGGISSWLLGYWLSRRFPLRQLSEPKYARALEWIRRGGGPVLLLSWLPVVGDPLCLVAGWLRISWLQAIIYISLSKALRYYVLLLPFAI